MRLGTLATADTQFLLDLRDALSVHGPAARMSRIEMSRG
jgi:hypothetical protein